MPNRPYIFYEYTQSLCSQCLRTVTAKVLLEDGKVYLKKRCPEHGFEKVLIGTDIPYFKKTRQFLKPAEMPLRFNTPIRYGCPYDCGLCPDHEQHSCLSILEITERCNLTCPTCYAGSSPDRGAHRSLEEVEAMLRTIVANEGEPDIVQISGGEPTLHPQFFDILDRVKKSPVRHLMLNTNGLRLAQDPAFVERLASYAPGFEIYLQFDSLREEPLRHLRGENLLEIRRRALENLNRWNLSTTLVVTLKKGLNDGEIGDILRFALTQKCVRGVSFQPVQAAGRLKGFDPARDRLTLSEVRRNILAQSDLFSEKDIVPVPCHPDSIAMAYALKTKEGPLPLTGLIGEEDLLSGGANTIIYEQEPALKEKIFSLFSTRHSPGSSAQALKSLLCCLPKVSAPEPITYDNVFRVIVMQFMDAYNFDVRSVKKSCVHMVEPDGRVIPFDTYNLFYRGDKQDVLKKLRAELETAPREVLS